MPTVESSAEQRVSTLDRVVIGLDRLVAEDLRPGSQLPSEAGIAREYGVSRLTVREALKVLAGQGVVRLRTGARATVTTPSSAQLGRQLDRFIRHDPRAVLELGEVRMGLEMQAASLAATHTTRAGNTAITAALDKMRAAAVEYGEDVQGSEEAYHNADLEFHEALAAASGNRMLATILAGLEDAMRLSFVHGFRGHLARGSAIDNRFGLHQRVAELVAAGDAPGAASAMATLLTVAEQDVATGLASKLDESDRRVAL